VADRPEQPVSHLATPEEADFETETRAVCIMPLCIHMLDSTALQE
jgi:hypothetical protein